MHRRSEIIGEKGLDKKMADNKNCFYGNMPRECVTLSVNRVLDSCRDKDCFEDVKVFLSENGQEIIEKTGNLRVKCTEVVWTSLTVEPVKFNRGFYSVEVRFYVKLTLEACICPGKVTEFEGLAVCEKKIILYGGEGNVSIFRSGDDNGFCSQPFSESKGNSLPFAVCEVADPIALSLRTVRAEEKCGVCCCYADELPDCVTSCFNSRFGGDGYDQNGRELLVTLGFFSVIRLERPGQFLVHATESCVPEKECCCEEIDPCSVFKHMEFPVGEFCTGFAPKSTMQSGGARKKDCGCK